MNMIEPQVQAMDFFFHLLFKHALCSQRTYHTYVFTYLLNLLAYSYLLMINRDHISKERKVVTDTSVQILIPNSATATV